MLDTTEQALLPFLKWAGGKRWLTTNYDHLLDTKFDRYIEPFLGGAAIFFYLQPTSAILSDVNGELINVYAQIKANWGKVRRALVRHNRNHSDTYYYSERNRTHRAKHEKAAQLLYLNRTCWNGLYRVNKNGEFNVPIGTKDTVLLDTDDFKFASKLLKNALLRTSDFEKTIDAAEEGDFVFIDPPYITRHNFNGFVKYNDKIFSWADQERLAAAIRRAAKRNVKILLTNADHRSVRALYHDLGSRITLKRKSVLAAASDNRGATTEMAVLVNY